MNPGVGRIIAWPQTQTSRRVTRLAMPGCIRDISAMIMEVQSACVRAKAALRATAGSLSQSGR
ncbi:hypothetical protein D3C78_1894010 [compost metagenome]